MTLREWIPQWLECYKLGTIKERSFHQLELLIRHIPGELMDMELSSIKPMHLQGFINRFSAGASKSYIHIFHPVLHFAGEFLQQPVRLRR